MPNLFDSDTNKQGLIVYGGESSSSYGMVVAEAPAFERPKRKQTIYSVPGRNGSIIFQQDAWEDVTRSYKVWLTPSSNKTLVERVDAVEAWLNTQNGYVRLEDNFEPDVFRLAYYSGGDGFTNNMTQYGEATLNFTCRPERFLKSGDTAKAFSLSYEPAYCHCVVDNPTRYESKPIFAFTFNAQTAFQLKFRLWGWGGGDLTVDLSRSSTHMGTPFIIDCDAMEAYYTDSNGVPIRKMNNCLSGNFPRIPPGHQVVNVDIQSGSLSTILSATCTPRFFTI